MDWVLDWAREIILIVMAISFLELVLPSGGMKKYLKFIFSLVILSVILFPLNKGVEPALDAFEPIATNQSSIKEPSVAALQRAQTLQLAEVIQEKARTEINNIARNEFPDISITSIEIYLNEEIRDPDYGQVRWVVIQTDHMGPEKEFQGKIAETLKISTSQIRIEESDTGGKNEGVLEKTEG